MADNLPLNIKLPLPLVRRIDRAAYERTAAGPGIKATRSSVIRELLEAHVPHYEQPPATPRARTRAA